MVWFMQDYRRPPNIPGGQQNDFTHGVSPNPPLPGVRGVGVNSNGGKTEMMVTFVVAGDGSVSVKTQELQQDPPSGESRLPEIIDKLKDPRTPSAAIRRLALAELLVIAQEMAAEQRNMTP